MYSHKQLAQQGAAMLFFIIFFVVAASALTFLLGRSIYSDVLSMRLLATSKQAYLTAESALEDVVFRTTTPGYVITGSEVLVALVGTATTTQTYDAVDDSYVIRTESRVGTARRVGVVELALGAGTAFNYGLQAGNGGFRMAGNSEIVGNAYANGSIEGQGSSLVSGDAISAGASGLIEKMEVTGNAWANTIGDSEIHGSAYYNVIGSKANVVHGTTTKPFSPLPTAQDMPVPDSKVEEWKTVITNTGTEILATDPRCLSGTYLITTNTTLGNVKINCNLEIRKTGASTVVTLTGPVWVTGNIEITQGPTIRAAATLGRFGVQMIADNPSNRLTSSKIAIRNATTFAGSGHPSSFVMLLSQNNSGELGGIQVAAEIAQSANGSLIVHAGHGIVNIANNIDLKSVTGYRVVIGNGSSVTYDTGLANTLFTGGPGGGYVIADWSQE